MIVALLGLFKGLGAAELPAPVLRELKAVGLPPSSVSAVVQEVGAPPPPPLLSVRASAVVNPASLMKLVTTLAALELLSPAYRWKTEVYVDGALRGDVLEGALVLRGTGDPKLNFESFWMLLRSLRSRGLREIRGEVVIDRSHFGPVADGRIDDDTFRPYNVVPDALLVNFKSLRFSFLPEPDRGGVRVFAEPSLPGMELVNTLRLVERGGCPEGRAFRDLIQASFQSRPPRALFTGVYPLSCGERDLNVALHEPEDYVETMIRQLWAELGGTWVDGAARATVRNGTVPPSARLVYVHESEPLAEIVRDINKFSNNVMARQLYLTLAAEMGGAPARPQAAHDAIRKFLEDKGIRAPELVIENGSGLSRNERMSVANLAALLQVAWRSPVMPEFVSSLPVVATDGTMKKRLLAGPVAGHAHIKTGLLQDVRGSAGYVLDRNGRRHAVVMVINHPRAPEGQEALDALLAWVYEHGSRGRAPSTGRPPASSQRHP